MFATRPIIQPLRLGFIYVCLQVVLPGDLVGQDSPTMPRGILSASFRYQNLVNAWDIAFFGTTGELRVSDKVSFSGSFFLGKGPGNAIYAHLPIAGLAAWLPLLGLAWLADPDDPNLQGFSIPPVLLKLLMMENTHYNIQVRENIVVSPYVNFLSLDGEVSDESSQGDFVSLSTGLGLSAKIFLSDRFVLIPDIVTKYFFVLEDRIYGDLDRVGYALTLLAGYVFF
jgi:hypothetical protein